MFTNYVFNPPKKSDLIVGEPQYITLNYSTDVFLPDTTYFWNIYSDNGIEVNLIDNTEYNILVFEIIPTSNFIGEDTIHLELIVDGQLYDGLEYDYTIVEADEDLPEGDIQGTATFEPNKIVATAKTNYELLLIANENGANDWIVTCSDDRIEMLKVASDQNRYALKFSTHNIDFSTFNEDNFIITFKNRIPSTSSYYVYTYNVKMVGTNGSGDSGNTSGSTSIVITPTPSEQYVEYDDLNSFDIYVSAGSTSIPNWGFEPNIYFDIIMTTQQNNSFCVYRCKMKSPNTSHNIINTTLKFTAEIQYGVVSECYVKVEIGANKQIAVWEDEIYSFNTNGDVVTYTIKNENTQEIIYSGKAKKYPNSNNIDININNIIRGYLNNSFSKFGNNQINILQNYSTPFSINVDNVRQAQYIIFNDWSYNNNVDGINLSEPILNVIDNRQYFMFSLYSRFSESFNERYNIYSDNNLTINVPVSPTFQTLICDDLKKYSNPKRIRIGGYDFNVKQTCYDYCLYYTNAFGGWDSLLIQGNVLKSDKITSSYYSKTFNNTTIDFEKVKYHNNLITSYQLYTDWFNDEQQSKLHHLLESTEVYLHNLVDNEIYPVIITNTKCDWKTFKNNGKKKWYNTINVELSQSKIRL